jgi:hypothetical protein
MTGFLYNSSKCEGITVKKYGEKTSKYTEYIQRTRKIYGIILHKNVYNL